MKTFTVVSLLCACVISCSEIVTHNNEQQQLVIPVVPLTPDGKLRHYEDDNIVADLIWAPKKINARKIKRGDGYVRASMVSYYNSNGVGIDEASNLARRLEFDFEEVKENNEDKETEYKVEEVD